ncbi:hypothetical protein [Clostridium perfringens]|uniref:hypothetical protein n=1 Tax=Clostridium perfringens TaxID=1502 RepID=UPI0024BC3BD7|nr:hypothetical protein [Clostridium perfringens]
MDKGKIIQIIPCNQKLYAKYEDEGTTFTIPIVCYALIEYINRHNNEKIRVVEPMGMGVDGIIDSVINDINFKEILNIEEGELND